MKEREPKVPPSGGGGDDASLRTRLRRGNLARERRPDPDGALERREPDELLLPEEGFAPFDGDAGILRRTD